MPEFMRDAEFWVLIAFVIAVGFLIYKAKGKVIAALDERAAKIKTELDQAQRLREEAQEKLAEYQRKQRDALKEAEAIVAHAKVEAERVAAQAARDLEAAIERRKRLALEKIALTETKALAEVRNLAVDLAVACSLKTSMRRAAARSSTKRSPACRHRCTKTRTSLNQSRHCRRLKRRGDDQRCRAAPSRATAWPAQRRRRAPAPPSGNASADRGRCLTSR